MWMQFMETCCYARCCQLYASVFKGRKLLCAAGGGAFGSRMLFEHITVTSSGTSSLYSPETCV
jgi:hypothetical protein